MLPPDLAYMVNWERVKENFGSEKLKDIDYTNLPTPHDLLVSLGVITSEVIPGQYINGQPAQKFIVSAEYAMEEQGEEELGIIDITDTANPRREGEKC